jgi:futalosine hydrolase
MQLLLCAATMFEIQPAIDRIKEKNLPVEILVTGVGSTAASYHLTKKIMSNKPGFVLQAGVAGSFDEQLALGEVVMVENEMIGDLGVREDERFKDLFQLGLADLNHHPFSNGKLINDGIVQFDLSPAKKVHGVTVNEITTNNERINHYKQLGAQVESLEGAALHYVALAENVRFLQLRSISNYVGERDKSKWVLHEAIRTLNDELIQIIDKLV